MPTILPFLKVHDIIPKNDVLKKIAAAWIMSHNHRIVWTRPVRGIVTG